MSSGADVIITYVSDLTKAKSDWDAFVTYTQQHPPGAAPASGNAPGTATTFSGLSTTAGPASGYAASAAANQDMAIRLSQAATASSASPQTSSTPGGGSYRSWLSGELRSQPSDLHRAQVLDQEIQSTRRLQSAFSEGTPGYAAYGRDVEGMQGRADRYRAGYSGLGDHGIIPFSTRPSSTNWTWGSSGGASGGSGIIPWSASPGTRAPVGGGGSGGGPPFITDDSADEGGGANDDIGWTYRGGRGGRGGGAGGRRPSTRRRSGGGLINQLGIGLGAGQIASSITGMLNNSNQYNIASAGSTSFHDVVSNERNRQSQSWLGSLPVVGSLGSSIREFDTGENAGLTGTLTNLDLEDRNSGLRRQFISNRNQGESTRLRMEAGNTGEATLNHLSIRSQANTDIDQSKQDDIEQRKVAERDIRAIEGRNRRGWLGNKINDVGIGFKSESDRQELRGHHQLGESTVGNWLLAHSTNPEPDAAEKEKIAWLRNNSDQKSGLANQYQQQRIKQRDEEETGYGISQGYQHLNAAEDIQDRNRYTVSSSYRGRMMPRTADAMDEITGDRRAVENFNQNHLGPEWATQRAQNTQSYVASQQQSQANLQQLGEIPGNAQEVSGMTSFGDFSNQGFKDYSKALDVSAGGGAEINQGAQQADVSGGMTEVTAQGLLQALNALTTRLGQTNGAGG